MGKTKQIYYLENAVLATLQMTDTNVYVVTDHAVEFYSPMFEKP